MSLRVPKLPPSVPDHTRISNVVLTLKIQGQMTRWRRWGGRVWGGRVWTWGYSWGGGGGSVVFMQFVGQSSSGIVQPSMGGHSMRIQVTWIQMKTPLIVSQGLWLATFNPSRVNTWPLFSVSPIPRSCGSRLIPVNVKLQRLQGFVECLPIKTLSGIWGWSSSVLRCPRAHDGGMTSRSCNTEDRPGWKHLTSCSMNKKILRWQLWNPVKSLPGHSLGNLWFS